MTAQKKSRGRSPGRPEGRHYDAYVSALPRGCEEATRRLAEDVSEDALSAFDGASSLVEVQAVHLIAAIGQQRDRPTASLTVMEVAMKEKLFGVLLNQPAVLRMRRQRPLAVPVRHDSETKDDGRAEARGRGASRASLARRREWRRGCRRGKEAGSASLLQCLCRIDPERASQRHRARRKSNGQHDAVRGQQQHDLAHRSEPYQCSQPTAGEYARADLQEGAREDAGRQCVLRPAPSAMRIPISRVRRATVNDISEWMPVAERSNTMNEINHATPVSVQLSVAPPTSASP